MSDSARLVTAEELERLPDDDYRYELVEGRVIRMSPVGFEHGRLVVRLGYLLTSHLRERGNPGFVLTEVGFKLASNPDTVRAPDSAFVRKSRVPSPDTKGFLKGPPDLAVEVLSPDDTPREVQQKVDEYLERGVQAVVVINPDLRTATVSRPADAPLVLRDTDALNLDDVVFGFRCTIREIFE